jgi:hypothetical protein
LGAGFSAVSLTGPVTPFSIFHLSIASRKDFTDFSTAFSFPRASAVPAMTTQRVCAAAMVQGMIQQETAIRTMLGRTTAPSFRELASSPRRHSS